MSYAAFRESTLLNVVPHASGFAEAINLDLFIIQEREKVGKFAMRQAGGIGYGNGPAS